MPLAFEIHDIKDGLAARRSRSTTPESIVSPAVGPSVFSPASSDDWPRLNQWCLCLRRMKKVQFW